MEYIIAGLRIDIPREFTTGAFGMALAPFAAKEAADAEGKGATDADANEAADAEPQGAPDAAKRAAGAEGKGATDADEAADAEGKGATDANEAAGAEPQGDPDATKQAAPDNADKSPSEAAATAPASPTDGMAQYVMAQYGLCIRTAQQVGEGADYRELDAFDFAEADADCRFGRDAEGYLLTITPRDGSAPARFRKAFGSPVATSDITLQHKPALFRFGLWTLFNIAAVERQAVAVHSSVIFLDGRAVLFLGESGTGKSTHTRLWREHIPGAKLLNDDSPIVRIASAPTPAGVRVPGENTQASCTTAPDSDESVPPMSEKRLANMRSQRSDTTARIADTGSQKPREIAQSAEIGSQAPGQTDRIANTGSQKPREGTCAAEENRSSESRQADIAAHDPAPGSDTSGIQCSGSDATDIQYPGSGTDATAAHRPVASTRIPGTQSPGIGVPPPGRQADTPEVVACGSPWSGKTPCYRNESYPIAGIVRLSQAPHNRIRRLRPIEAIGALLPSCPPSFAHDEQLSDAVCRLVSGIVAQVPVYHLECLPDAAAAELACKTVLGR